MDEIKYKFGIKLTKLPKEMWSFGSGISHSFGETYLFINLVKLSIAIGRLAKEVENENR